MELNEMIALMAAPIYAGRYKALLNDDAMEKAVQDAVDLWAITLQKQKTRKPSHYLRGDHQ